MKTINFLLSLALTIGVLNANNTEDEIEILQSSKSLTLEAALLISKATFKSCTKSGYRISVSILDNAGNIISLQKGKMAGLSTPEAATLKAKTAINFRAPSEALSKSINKDKDSVNIKHLPGILLLGGGLPIYASGSMVGAIGVAGAPGGHLDEVCARDGIEAIEELLEMAD